MINVDDAHLLVVLGQRRLGTAIVGGIESPESLLWRPCLWDFGGWQRGAVGYVDDDDKDRRRT
jgi:hypothetical protein